MKKILIYLSVIFSFLVVLSTEEIHNIKGEEIGGTEKNTQYYYDNDDSISLNNYYATHYFYNLKNNFSNNLVGSCAYVALSMLLSFYDTYWDDSYILSNGVIVISDGDYKKLLNNEIAIPAWEEK